MEKVEVLAVAFAGKMARFVGREKREGKLGRQGKGKRVQASVPFVEARKGLS